MTEAEARAALRAFVGIGDIEPWIAGRPWQAAPGGDAAEPGLQLMVARLRQPPFPWFWKIKRDGEAKPRERSERGYRSAEDAWAVGKAVLANIGRQADPER